MDDYDYLFKCIVVGDGGCGKTAIVVRFSKGFFKEKYKLTIGVEFAVKNLELNHNIIKLQIWDTGGQDRFQYVRPLYYKGAMGCIILFDLTNKTSYEHIPKWIEEVENEAGKIPMLLVGNKSDLKDSRQISREDAEKLATDLGIKYIESSAKTGEGVKDIFAAIAYLMLGEDIPDEYLEVHPISEESKGQNMESPVINSNIPPPPPNRIKIATPKKPKPLKFPDEKPSSKKPLQKKAQPMMKVSSKKPKPIPFQNHQFYEQSKKKSSDFNPFEKPISYKSDNSINKEKQDESQLKSEKLIDSKKPGENFYNLLSQSKNDFNSKDGNFLAQMPKNPVFEDKSEEKSQDITVSETIKSSGVKPKVTLENCPNCGTKLNPHFKFCHKCGKRI